MSSARDYFPDLIDKYYEMIKVIDEKAENFFKVKNRELILVAIGTAIGNENVIRFHAQRAMQNGSSKEELRTVAVMPLPIVGLTNCNKAIAIIDAIENNK